MIATVEKRTILARKVIAAAMMMAVPTICAAKDYALTMYVGYRGGGSFTDADTERGLELDSSVAVSIALDLPLDASRQIQIFLSHQRTDLDLDGTAAAGGGKLPMNIGVGYQWPVGGTLAVRVEARGYATLVNSTGGVFCSGGCVVSIKGDTVTQGELMLGLSGRF